jgi:ZIP family zinc transporter
MLKMLVLVLLLVLFPVVAMLVGALIATFRSPGPRVGSAIQHFAGGTVFAAVALELLPDVVRAHAVVSTIVGFAVGVALMLAIRELSMRAETRSKDKSAGNLGLVIAVGVDITIDGFLIDISFAAGAKQGLLLTIALSLELLGLGLATVTALHQAGASRGRSVSITAGLALLVLVGATVGTTVLAGVTGPLLNGVLAFGVAALLYLVTEELLVEAHEVPETNLVTSIFFVGFLVVLLIDLLV